MIDRAMQFARELALKYARQPWIDVVGFADDPVRVSVLAHSMETGRRLTVYVEDKRARIIRTGANDEPIWSEVTRPEELLPLLDWVTGVGE
jgi:hypothetical protein